jgi:outer membrane receptor protein involved in Fe transport
MQKKFTLPVLALLISFSSLAQSTRGVASGRVKDENAKQVHSATVSLQRLKDSAILKFTATGKNGEFSFEDLVEGSYRVLITSIGYEKESSTSFTISETNKTVLIPDIILHEAAKGLSAVTVVTKKPFIETRIDKTIVNVEASPTSAGATALEVLEKSPGVSVDNDGNISLRGKAGVTIMVDGKPTYLSATDLTNMLKNMPASALDQIEIMTNPSAKYDAAGNSGVINIKTKKGKADGFNGNIMASFTTSIYKSINAVYFIPKTQNGITFNYRKNKFNFFGNYNPNQYKGKSLLEITRRKIGPSGETQGYNDVETKFAFGNFNHTLKLGADFFADKKNTFGVVLSGFNFAGHPTPVTSTTSSDASHLPLATIVTYTKNHINFRNYTANFNYRHVFDTAGTEITADVDYIGYENVSKMTLTSEFYDGNGIKSPDSLMLKGRLPASINIFSFKSDYVHPFKNGRIEAGIKSSFVKNDNLVDYERRDINKNWIPDARSNHFVYNENINAAYVNVNKQLKKWALQGGLRLENTIAKGYQFNNDSTFKRNFTNLFPSAFISYALDEKSSLTVSYSRRITRPNYQDLNPFTYFLDTLSYRKGNPFLLPQFTHNFELSHSFKGKLITTLNYNSTTHVISQIIKPDGDILYLTSENVASFKNFGIAFTAPLPITKWWNSNTFVNVYNNHYTGIYANKPLDLQFTSFMINMTQTFTVKKGFTVEVSGFYRAKTVEQLNISEPMYVISAGAQKQVLQGKGTLRLNLRDPFWMQRYKGKTEYDIVDARISNKWDNRQVTASFTYRFGKSAQQNQQRRHNSATQDEQNRVGTGGN